MSVYFKSGAEVFELIVWKAYMINKKIKNFLFLKNSLFFCTLKEILSIFAANFKSIMSIKIIHKNKV
jgi:hypothetical protein